MAGAAAIVKQQHPDYTADQLRAALLSAATDVGLTSYQVGAGVVDIDEALDAPVVASGSGDFGMLAWGDEPTPVERTISYTNRTDAEVTIDLCNRGSIDLRPEQTAIALVREDAPTTVLCQQSNEAAIGTGRCISVSCEIDVPPRTEPFNLLIVGDPANQVSECSEANNRSVISRVSCTSAID